MNYIENIFLCLTMPVLVAVFCVEQRRRPSLLFLLSGMTMCLISAYISTFFAGVLGADALSATTNITPMVEEIMKLLPVLFDLLVFEPERRDAANGILMTAVGFATFENVCYLTTNGAADFLSLLIRGAGTGAMHIVCGLLMGLGLLAMWDVVWLKMAGTLALMGLVATYHAIYNLLVNQTGAVAVIGFLLPLATIVAVTTLARNALREIIRGP